MWWNAVTVNADQALSKFHPGMGNVKLSTCMLLLMVAEGHHDSHFGLVCNGQDLSNKFCRASRNLCKLPVSPDHTSRVEVDL